jgi:manganese transport protein
MVNVAYVDLGNYGPDISGGASFGYSMLWVVWLAGIMAMLLQLARNTGSDDRFCRCNTRAQLSPDLLGFRWAVLATKLSDISQRYLLAC